MRRVYYPVPRVSARTRRAGPRAGAPAPSGMVSGMSQLHVHADPGDVAEVVLLPGDPNRARRIAEAFFESPVRYTDHRQLLGFTGHYRGLRVSVQATGHGLPQPGDRHRGAHPPRRPHAGAGRHLRDRGRRHRARRPHRRVGLGANDGTTRQYLRGDAYAPAADFDVTRALVDAGAALGKPPHVGLIQTEDAFYATSPDDVPTLRARGVLAIEMEASALFLIAHLRGARAGCALVASNRIGDDSFVAPEVLADGVARMTRMTLDAMVALHAPGREA